MTAYDDPKHIAVMGYMFLRCRAGLYRCCSLGLEIHGEYGGPSPFTVCRVDGGHVTWARKLFYGKSDSLQRFQTRTGAAIAGMRKLCGITKARKGN